MKKYILLLFICLFSSLNSQTLVGSFPFPQLNAYNYFWGVTVVNDTFWVSTTYSGSVPYDLCYIYKVTREGQIVDSIRTPLKTIDGIEWDGTAFWVAEGYRSSTLGSRFIG